jgi:hypothetical protein
MLTISTFANCPLCPATPARYQASLALCQATPTCSKATPAHCQASSAHL